MGDLRIFRRKLDEGGKLALPRTLLRLFQEEVKILGSNPIAIVCPAGMDLEEIENHLRHLLLEVRKKVNGLDSRYFTH
ncbi:MAG: hypothetical protein QXF20_03600 [Candidatus Hadarchaeales archaeon]